MPEKFDRMVTKIWNRLRGKTNPRTHKKYTKSDAYAIAVSQWKKTHGGKPPSRGAEVDNVNNIQAAKWTRAFINDLPDSAFLYIESGGKKNSEGKTVPRTLRHLPFKDKSGKVDLPHLRNAIARLGQGYPKGTTPELRNRLMSRAKSLLMKNSESYRERQSKKAFVISTPFDIKETEIVEAEGMKRVILKGDLMDDSINKNHWRAKINELQNIASTFIGSAIKVQHSLDDWEVVGTGLTAGVMNNHIPYTAEITDKRAVAKFEEGSWNSKNMGISPKLGYKQLVCSICGGDAELCDHIRGKEYEGQLCFIDVIGAYIKEASLTSEPAYNPSAGTIDDVTLFASIDEEKLMEGLEMVKKDISGEEETEEEPEDEDQEEESESEASAKIKEQKVVVATLKKELKDTRRELEAKEKELEKMKGELKATNERLSTFVMAKREEELKSRLGDDKVVAQLLEDASKLSDEAFTAELAKIDAIQASIKKKKGEKPPEAGVDNSSKGSVPLDDTKPDIKAAEEKLGREMFGSNYEKLIGKEEK